MTTIQQHHIKALTPTWLLAKVSTAPPKDGGHSKKPAPAPAYSPLLLSPSAWQKAQDVKKSKDDAGDLPASPRISCMGQVKGRRKKRCSSAHGPTARGSSGHGGLLATLVLGLFGRRNGRTSSRACSKVRDMPRGQGSASATGSSHGHGGGGVVRIAVGVIDPPLPVVVRRPARSGDDAPSLWERRRGGGKALEGLQLPYLATESS